MNLLKSIGKLLRDIIGIAICLLGIATACLAITILIMKCFDPYGMNPNATYGIYLCVIIGTLFTLLGAICLLCVWGRHWKWLAYPFVALILSLIIVRVIDRTPWKGGLIMKCVSSGGDMENKIYEKSFFYKNGECIIFKNATGFDDSGLKREEIHTNYTVENGTLRYEGRFDGEELAPHLNARESEYYLFGWNKVVLFEDYGPYGDAVIIYDWDAVKQLDK